MCIEIRELIIKASVSAGGQQPGGPAAPGGAAAGQAGGDNNGVSGSEEMISTCIEKILEILREKNER
ncbi:MAG TPA: DUF5908 family protein [Chitinophagaceae bacterium]|nr:DUF5908 family protein [Chitinophagaceae bacterium]